MRSTRYLLPAMNQPCMLSPLQVVTHLILPALCEVGVWPLFRREGTGDGKD